LPTGPIPTLPATRVGRRPTQPAWHARSCNNCKPAILTRPACGSSSPWPWGHTDQLIGDCAAHVRADDPHQAEIGFSFAAEHQGHGYATEAVRRLLHYLLIERDKHRVSATYDDRNTRSAAVLERVGMRREGHLLESTWSKGEWTNDLLYGVLHRGPAGS
jgi:RimJ/RimL family protein N-acetyltransferase